MIADREQELVMEFPFAIRAIGYPLVSAGPGRSEGVLRQWRADAALARVDLGR
ncbi:MAG: hypothetical protein V2A58_18630 [Planctomycetota bacterium]